MRLIQYIHNNLKQKKGRTALATLGIMLSVVDILVMGLLIQQTLSNTSAFFLPFSHMDQILEKGADFTQLVPLSSTLKESLQSPIESFFDEPTIPMLMIAETEEVGNLYSTYYLGLPMESMDKIWDQVMLASGEYPTQTSQVIVGEHWEDLTVMEIKGDEFTVTGVLNDMHSFLDRVVVMDLRSLQELVNKVGFVTLFFISPEISESPAKIVEFENEFSTLDFLTRTERDELRGGLNQFVTDVATLFSTFTAISAIIFVFAIELLTILSRKGDFNIFFVLGAPKHRVFLVLALEILALFIVGILCSIPVSILLYILIWSYVNSVTKVDNTFWGMVKSTTHTMFQRFPFSIFLSNIGSILLFGLFFAVLIATIGLRTYKLEEMKQKF